MRFNRKYLYSVKQIVGGEIKTSSACYAMCKKNAAESYYYLPILFGKGTPSKRLHIVHILYYYIHTDNTIHMNL